jgi:succinyl-CoA synthetase alpha subunit
MMRVRNYLDRNRPPGGTKLPGLLTLRDRRPALSRNIAIPGNIRVVSRSGTLTYEVLMPIRCWGWGFHLHRDRSYQRTNFMDALGMFEADPYTEKVVLTVR